VDAKLLAVFDALFIERNATRAGRRLGVTQSTISHSLSRLRDLLNDDLFIRTARGMQPTPLALEIGPRVHRGLVELQNALTASRFTPESSTHQFTVVCTPYVDQVLMPHVIARLQRDAPRARIQTYAPSRIFAEELADGRIDLAIGIKRRVPNWIESRLLLTDHWMLAVRTKLARRVKSADDLRSFPHVALTLGRDPLRGIEGFPSDVHASLHPTLTDSLIKESEYSSFDLPELLRDPSAKIRVADPSGALSLAERCDVVAIVPKRLALTSPASRRLRLFDLKKPVKMELLGYWLKGNHDAASAWLRALIAEVASSL
jgi:DNA-binding transcriptional LysR family regulator